MALAEKQFFSSWSQGESPLVLSDIFSSNTSVAVWNREVDFSISRYFELAYRSLGMGLRGVFSMETLKQGLDELLPEGEAKYKAVEDIFLLSDMLTCLFNCDSVGLRLVPLKAAMCPKFHADNIPVRLVNTYLGPGTEWLPLEAISPVSNDGRQGAKTKLSPGSYYNPEQIQTMKAFDVGLLKGKTWEQHEQMAAFHRSCQLDNSEKRVLLTLDPM